MRSWTEYLDPEEWVTEVNDYDMTDAEWLMWLDRMEEI